VNPRIIRIVIVLMFTAMSGLVAIQLIWIRRAVLQREEQFTQQVSEALYHISSEYERLKWDDNLDAWLENSGLEAHMHAYLDSLSHIVFCAEGEVEGNYDAQMTQYRLNINLPGILPEWGLSPVFPDDFSLTDQRLGESVPSGTGLYLESLDEAYRLLTESRNIIAHMLRDLLGSLRVPQTNEIDSVLLESIITRELPRSGINIPFKYAVYRSAEGKISFGNLRNVKEVKESVYRMPVGGNYGYSSFEVVLQFPYKARFLLENIFYLLVASAVLILLIVGAFSYTITVIYKQKKVQEIKNDLINNITHELKTPISTISLACQAVADPDMQAIPGFQEKYMGIIRDENHRLGQLVENVLQSAVFERGESRLKIKKIDMHVCIEKVLGSLGMQSQAKGIKFNQNLHALNFVIDGDDVLITNLIFNLVDNAIKYSGVQNPQVSISTWNESDRFWLEVADNGIGINKDDQKRIFEKLYRVPTGNVHNVKGYGLGLSYVKSIVESHSGEIEVESQLGDGSRFTVSLPLIQNKS
jgi:two-component system phosphate regulon sensor histidine kinase PhoR